jgi:hypothetical protein
MVAAPPLSPPSKPQPSPVRKKLGRKRLGDRTQQLRRAVQLAFLALNIWI